MDERLHIFGIRHHGPGSAALLVRALDAVEPACVLIEGPPEADELIRFAQLPGMKPPLALLVHAASDANAAFFFPQAEFSPEWQAMLWALRRDVPARFIDWPAGIHIHALIAQKNDPEEMQVEHDPDPLDALAAAAGYGDGEAFWNSLIEQGRLEEDSAATAGEQALQVFAGIEAAMTAVRAAAPEERSERGGMRESQREAWMRIHIRQALKEHSGKIAAVVGAWHTSALRTGATASGDKALVKELTRAKVEATWVPWTDSRLGAASGYGAGVISPGWYSHLWSLYERRASTTPEEFAAQWQAKTAGMLRKEGYLTPTASAIEAARLSLALASMRERRVPALEEMREAALATLCHGDEVPLRIIERKLYVGERVGEIDSAVPQMPLARDLALWQKKTRLKPEDVETEQRVDLRSEAGLLKSTLLHRLLILKVPWGKLVEADAGRGTFREVWRLRWAPELSVALAEALVYGGTIEQAAGNAQLDRAAKSNSISELAEMVRETLVADLPDAATACIERLQAAAVQAAEITELMLAVPPLVRVLRYGTARKLPEEQLRALVHALSVEVNAGVRLASHNLDDEAATARVQAMQSYDEALRLFADSTLIEQWQNHLSGTVDDPQVSAAIAGLSLRRLHEFGTWAGEEVESAFSRHVIGETPQRAGAFLENFLRGGSEVLLHDEPLLNLIDAWLCGLEEQDFIESLPLLRRSFAEFDIVARRHVMQRITHGRREQAQLTQSEGAADDAFALALPLLCQILGIDVQEGAA
ncbi:DUF5682 family protein [Occallatibacter riparius]|uniref:DUF5682 family protein n=1 Tax=Occallatibacter riparius TaxID=1002689 RepID=A0A9J7BWF1_9BACT|nr:DUF5682 family protein [Occallatibacter riparius]UWZ86833.1 DUF5682 family protein [Occallatibacter riparius]